MSRDDLTCLANRVCARLFGKDAVVARSWRNHVYPRFPRQLNQFSEGRD